MSEPKFTPRPWIFGTNSVWTISSAAHSGSLMGNATYYPLVPENKADWHLIAAAPDLFYVVGAFVSWLNDNDEISLMELGEDAKAALAKARGEG